MNKTSLVSVISFGKVEGIPCVDFRENTEHGMAVTDCKTIESAHRPRKTAYDLARRNGLTRERLVYLGTTTSKEGKDIFLGSPSETLLNPLPLPKTDLPEKIQKQITKILNRAA